MTRQWRYGDTGTRLDRITAFTDGVFAVAITLLVLDLRVPVIAQEHVTEDMQMSPGSRHRRYSWLLGVAITEEAEQERAEFGSQG